MRKVFCLIFAIIFLSGNINLWATAIEVGSPAIDRTNYKYICNTLVEVNNPANASGTIDHIEIYMPYSDLTKLDVAVFSADGNFLTTNGYVEDLTALIGYNEYNAPGDFTAFNINEGEYIGCHGEGPNSPYVYIEKDDSGAGYWEKSGDNIPCSDVEFTRAYNSTISLYATGTESGGPPIAVGVQSQILMLK